MALVNAFLVRWARGYTDVVNQPSIDLYGRKEGFLSLGDAQSVAEAQAVCKALFKSMAEPQIATTMAIEPTGVDDVPYTHFRKGDYITAPSYEGGFLSQRVRALTTSVDEDDKIIFVPEMRSVIQEEAERIHRWLKRMANGAAGGVSHAPSPTGGGGGSNLTLASTGKELPPHSLGGAIFASTSGVYRPPTAVNLIRWSISLNVAGTSVTTVQLLVGGVAVETLSVDPGVNYAYENIDQSVPANTMIQARITTAGSGAESLVVQLLAG